MSDTDFLIKLQKEAKFQAELEKKRILPKKIDVFTSFVARYTWQFVLVLAMSTALFIEIFALVGE